MWKLLKYIPEGISWAWKALKAAQEAAEMAKAVKLAEAARAAATAARKADKVAIAAQDAAKAARGTDDAIAADIKAAATNKQSVAAKDAATEAAKKLENTSVKKAKVAATAAKEAKLAKADRAIDSVKVRDTKTAMISARDASKKLIAERAAAADAAKALQRERDFRPELVTNISQLKEREALFKEVKTAIEAPKKDPAWKFIGRGKRVASKQAAYESKLIAHANQLIRESLDGKIKTIGGEIRGITTKLANPAVKAEQRASLSVELGEKEEALGLLKKDRKRLYSADGKPISGNAADQQLPRGAEAVDDGLTPAQRRRIAKYRVDPVKKAKVDKMQADRIAHPVWFAFKSFAGNKFMWAALLIPTTAVGYFGTTYFLAQRHLHRREAILQNPKSAGNEVDSDVAALGDTLKFAGEEAQILVGLKKVDSSAATSANNSSLASAPGSTAGKKDSSPPIDEVKGGVKKATSGIAAVVNNFSQKIDQATNAGLEAPIMGKGEQNQTVEDSLKDDPIFDRPSSSSVKKPEAKPKGPKNSKSDADAAWARASGAYHSSDSSSESSSERTKDPVSYVLPATKIPTSTAPVIIKLNDTTSPAPIGQAVSFIAGNNGDYSSSVKGSFTLGGLSPSYKKPHGVNYQSQLGANPTIDMIAAPVVFAVSRDAVRPASVVRDPQLQSVVI